MTYSPESVLLILSAGSSFALGALVLVRNPHKRTHQTFVALTLNLMLWALGVLFIIHSHSHESAVFWIKVTFAVASFLPSTYYSFIAMFPHQRFVGNRYLLVGFWLCSLTVCVGTMTPYYLKGVEVFPDRSPRAEYGFLFTVYGISVATSMGASFVNLVRKLRLLSGVERRQVQHVILGVFLSTSLATATNILAPILNIENTEAYGPNFMVLMALIFAYAMVRYHLLGMWVLFSRTTLYATLTLFVVLVFASSVWLVQWVSLSGGKAPGAWSILLASLVIAVVLQPLKEHLQLFLDRTLLKRRYDASRLLTKVSQSAAETVRLDELLKTVAREIQQAVGVAVLRILLLDEKDPSVLTMEFSSNPGEKGRRLHNHILLVDHMRVELEPLLLEKLLHEKPSPERTQLAGHLAELDAYLCVPLKTSSRLVGMLTLGQKASRDIYSTEDLMLFTALAGPLGTAIENARLYRKIEEVNLHRARILSHMRGAVIAVDTDGRISTVNRAARDLLGPIEVGQHYTSLVPDLAEILAMTLFQGRAISDYEMMLTAPDGDANSIVVSSSCLHTANHETVGAMLMIYDLTAIRRLEQNVQRADRLSSLGTLAAGMAHEIKNPLVSIKTFTQLLLSRFDDSDFRNTFSEVVPHEVERIDSIVMRLLDFARPKPAEFALHNLHAILDEVLALVDNELRRHCIRVETHFAEDCIEIYGDEQHLHQVFLNLVLNAIDALKESEGGLLQVSARNERTHLRNGRNRPFDEVDCVRMIFADSGCGIPADSLQRIFTPFYTTKQHGSGLGLAVVHGIVTEHGGEIDVTSNPGEGTTFVLTLPLSRSASPVEDR